ncbi:Ribonuclease III domain [Sesbania bispinosa]|nr:Ribonuclease III domain [Sesbania bispinosa]
MPDGESSTAGAGQPPMQSSSSVSDDGQSLSLSQVKIHEDPIMKDPKKIARKYQLELCKKAMEENIIVYLGTGCGKTHIAVLLMHEMGHLIRKPKKDVCVFLAPTVALVHQQAKVIEDSTDFKVGTYCGSSKRLRRHQDWEQEIGQYEVLVMTPQILLHNLSHCFIKMEMIALLIFDECHHAQVKSNHPYAEIMKVFYKNNSTKVPRIFGMTASPVVGKGSSSEANLPKSINSLEHMLDAKVYSVEDKELQSFVTTPVINIYPYASTANGENSLNLKIEEIKRQCIATLGRSIEDHQKRMNTKKLLSRIHDNVVFCLGNLGIWGALQASRILLSGDHSERHELVEAEGNSSDESVCNKYLAQAAELFNSQSVASDNSLPIPYTVPLCMMLGDSVSDPSSVEILKEPFFSTKLLRLIGILSNFRLQQNMKCIIFVNRIVTARSLSYILQKLKLLRQWRSDFLVGVHSGLKSMSRKTMNVIVEKFRSGELNLLVATKVGEEGLDIQTCCLVIRFDLPETVASFIQSRGRARMPQSEYAFLVDSGNTKELDIINGFERDESRMNMEITVRTSNETYITPEERIFRVESSGASVSSGYSISLLHQYCSKLPHDEYFEPKPNFYYFDDLGGIVCHITLPSNAPIHQIVSTPQLSMEASKRDACLKAIEELYKLGALSDCLLPEQDDAEPEEQILGSSDSDECEEDISRGELHEMLVPSAFGHSWINEKIVYLNSYYIKFCPCPEDRDYRRFGLFIMTRLPMEAEKLELDLHLAHGRSVMTKFIPFGVVEFDKDEVKMAENFQEIFLKIILDRLEFASEFVDLAKVAETQTSTSTFYLLLPVILQEYDNIMKVDWKTVKRCLCSPIFRHPADTVDKKVFPLDIHLQLANGYRSVRDVENSLVYAPHKKLFYFVTNISYEKNGFSSYKDSGTSRYVDHFLENPWKFVSHNNATLKYFLEGRPCPRVCSKETEESIHFCLNSDKEQGRATEIRCNKNHHWLHRKTIADVVEALIGAFIVDSGFKAAIAFLKWLGIEVDFEASQVVNMCRGSASYFSLSADVDIPSLERKLGHHFVHKGLLLQAFVHPSYSKHGGGCYQRLEFLGDAVLDYLITSYLYSAYPKLKPGQLTDLRSLSVNNKAFACVAVDRSFDKFLLCDSSGLSEAIKKYVDYIRRPVSCRGINGEPKCPKALGDLVESCVGAILLDSGFNLNKVWKIMTSFLDPIMKFSSSLQLSPIRDLQELCQSHNLDLGFLPSKLTKTFSVEAKVTGNAVLSNGGTITAWRQPPHYVMAIWPLFCSSPHPFSSSLLHAVQAQGWKPKSKTLEDVLKSTFKMEPKLIGYDETPIDVTDTNTIGQAMVNGNLCSKSDPEIRPIREVVGMCSPCVKPVDQHLQSSPKGKLSETFENHDCSSDSSRTGYIKTLRALVILFTFKVTLEIEEVPDTIFEFILEPQSKKKDAAESAAEGAFWYLEHEGYLVNANG